MTDEFKIEVTPAMIEAGAGLLRERWMDLRRPSSAVLFESVSADVFRAMRLAQLGFPAFTEEETVELHEITRALSRELDARKQRL
jgi:hypothetical protein